MARIKRVLLSIALLSQACGAPSPYLKVVGKFAETTSSSTSSLLGAIDFSHRTCEDRAQIDYLQHRLEKTNVVGDSPVYWRDWYTRYKSPTGLTWEQQCKAFQTGDAMMQTAIVALSGYAEALACVANEDNYEGKDMGSLTEHTSELLGKLPEVPGPTTQVVKSLGGENGPIATLTGTLKKAYAAKEVVAITTAADPSVQGVLKALATYVEAIGMQESQWENESRTVLNSVDQLLAESPNPSTVPHSRDDGPLQLLTFYETTRRWLRDFDTARMKQVALADALRKLSRAEAELVQANGDSKSPHLQTVLGLINQISADIITIQNAKREGMSQ